MLGWSESDLLGKSSQWLLHPDDRERTRTEIDYLAAGRRTVRFESRFRHKEGSYRWISWKAVPDRGRIYATGRDVTELKDAENALRETRRELAEVARRSALAVMTAAVAHEIRQPLGAIVMTASAGRRWLDRSPPDLDAVRDSLQEITEAGHRASEAIESIRAVFSKSDQGRTLVDANDLVRETIAIMRGELDAAGVSVQFELNAQLPQLSVHKGQLQQVILNIVSNAADAMRAVTDRVRVLQLKSERSESNGVTITIEDSGTGIDAGVIDQIFNAFFTTKEKGMGMGLAICQSIVNAHGGRLSASAATPYGSAFFIALPGAQ
jgi:C4-dicarboxylate-specific signal transduction histidine kinase